VQFWQAVEIFSPQSLPKLDPKNHTVDIQLRDRVPWEPGSRLPKAKANYAWRHEVYGGLYELGRVRDLLVGRYCGHNTYSLLRSSPTGFWKNAGSAI